MVTMKGKYFLISIFILVAIIRDAAKSLLVSFDVRPRTKLLKESTSRPSSHVLVDFCDKLFEYDSSS